MPACVAAFIAIFFVLKLPPIEEQHWKMKLKRIDFLGSAILVLAVADLLLALDRGSNISWQDKVTLGTLGAAVALFAAFLFVEIRVASEPLAPSPYPIPEELVLRLRL